MQVAVIGSRNLSIDLEKYIPKNTTEIISGGAVGIDTLAELYAVSKKLPIKIYKPEYNRYGKAAPIIRNKLIVDDADMVIAIWDGHSRGTKFSIDYAKKKGKPIKVVIPQY